MLIHPAEARRQFREYAEGEITNANLAQGALLIALEEYPRLDVAGYLDELDGLATRVEERCSPGEPPVFRLGHLHAEMFDADGYRGDTASYYDPRNAYLNEVIDRRCGIPIALSIVFLHVAAKLGFTAFGVGLPGHYIVKVQFELNEVYVDPFHDGTTLTMNEIGALLRQVSGGRATLGREHLRAWTGRETLARVLANLQSMWTRAGDTRRAGAAQERMEMLARRERSHYTGAVKLFVTIYEETAKAALDAIRALSLEHDGIEVRAERFPSIDLGAIRAATAKSIILTYRGSRVPDVALALQAGIDYVDVEWHEGVEVLAPQRTVLSHHDYEGMHDVESIAEKMLALRCAYTKLAATPRSFADNERLLRLLPSTAVIGMGERGLYTRILAPFRGAALTFVAAGSVAAPSQLTLQRALDIYGRDPQRADKVFAIAGNPAGHSLSPSIHNRRFREKGVSAAYTIASIERFDEITDAFLRGEPCGLSVTTPFKDEAFAFACEHGAEVGKNAQRAGAVNTLVNLGDRILADNTDVDGFAALLPHDARRAAVLGASGTARAALVALANAGIEATVYNRTVSKGDAPLEAIRDFSGDLIINTLPAGVDVTIPPCETYIEAAYGGTAREVEARHRIGGLELLHAQAVRQHELFMKALNGL